MRDFILLLVLGILFGLGYFLTKKLDTFLKNNPKFSKHGTIILESDYKIPTDKMKKNGVFIFDDVDKTK